MPLGSRFAAVLVHLLMAVGFGWGCATTMSPPARSSGASLSDDGISMAVVGQTCAEVRAAGGAAPSLEATFAVEVGNPTPQPVTVHPERMLLRAPGPIPPQSFKRPDGQSDAVEGGTTQPFTLRFVAPGVTCSQELQLDSGSALEWRGGPVTLSAVRFVPSAPGTGPARSP